MNKLFKTVVSVVTASTMALSAIGTFSIASAAEDKGGVMPTYESTIKAVEAANDYYQTHTKPAQGEYGIPTSFWHKGAYEAGNMEAYYTTGIEAYRNYALSWASACSWKGHTSNAPKEQWTYGYSQTLSDKAVLFGDFQICFQTFIDLYNIEKNETYGKTVDPNKVARAIEVMGYEADQAFDGYWWWADSLFMVMPVMTKLYKLTGDVKYLDKLYVQFRYAKELMYDGPGGIPTDASGYTTSAKLSNGAKYSDPNNYSYLFFRDAGYVYPLKPNPGHENEKNFWARGDGWVFAGLAKVLQDMPDDYEHYDEFYKTYMEMAPAIKNCMVKDDQGYGFWTQSMLQKYPVSNENPFGYETSGTAFFVYGFAWGINAGLLSKDEYLDTTVRAWNYLQDIALQPDGKVGYIQYIGSNATKAMTKNDTQNFGVGAYLLAGCEMSRLVGGVQGDMQPYLQKKLQGNMALRVGSPHYYINSAVGHVDESDHNVTVYMKANGDGFATAMLPARAIVEKFGGTVEWNEGAQTVTAKIGNRTVVFTVGSKDILVNGEKMEAPVATEITNNRTFVPIRALCESLGKKVYWNDCGDASKGVIVIGEKAKPFYDCDYNMVLMLQELLGTNRKEGHNFKARPAQPEKDFAIKVQPLADTNRIQADSIVATSEPEGDHGAMNSSDGKFDENSRWATDQQGGSCTYTYKEPQAVGQVALTFWKPNQRTTKFKLEYTEDGNNWVQVFNGASTLGKASEIFDINKTVKAFRVSGYGNSENQWFSLIEFAVYKPGYNAGQANTTTPVASGSNTTSTTATGTKVAVNASSCKFSQEPEAANPGRNAFDGNAGTVWASQNQANAVIDLGKSVDVTCVGVQFKLYEDDRTIPFSISVSDDNAAWTTTFNGASTPMSGAMVFAPVGKKARYVKVEVMGNTVSGWSSVSEIEVYSGDISAVATTTTPTNTTAVASSTTTAATGTKMAVNASSCKFSQEPEAANPGRNAFDNNAGSVWASQNQADVVIDLSGEKGVTCVGVQFKKYDDDRTIPFNVYVSNDKNSWTKTFGGASTPMSDAMVFAPVNQKAKFVKVEVMGNTVSGWSSVAEIAVYTGAVTATANNTATTNTSFKNINAAGNFVIIEQATGKALTVGADGSLSVQAYTKGNNNQIWTKNGNIMNNVGSSKCLDVFNVSYDDGGEVGVWDSNGGDNQNWTVLNKGDYSLIQSLMSNLYLTVSSSGQLQQKLESSASKWIIASAN